jgi:hypothetical protein
MQIKSIMLLLSFVSSSLLFAPDDDLTFNCNNINLELLPNFNGSLIISYGWWLSRYHQDQTDSVLKIKIGQDFTLDNTTTPLHQELSLEQKKIMLKRLSKDLANLNLELIAQELKMPELSTQKYLRSIKFFSIGLTLCCAS